ncbi:MAG: HAMP domain-containing histidine kinase, partial [Lachnospiraceae bacterium]|nr:HAMP domain-containing histidine kinase [Lachnospiraceae bacterium]
MKGFDRIIVASAVLIVLVFLCANLFLAYYGGSDGARPYRVEVSRIAREIGRNGLIVLDGYQYVTNVEKIGEKGLDGCPGNPMWIYPKGLESDSDYLIREIGGILYRFDYVADEGEGQTGMIMLVNALLGAMAVFLFVVLLYIRFQILRPLKKLVDVPRQLSRGMLTMPLKENKNRYFGQLVWGMDLLREGMEEQKREALRRQQEHETMLSSLSHDIKTPLAAIKLYAKALEKELYTGKEKQLEIAQNIGKKADEAGVYIGQLTSALREDFLNLPIKEGEFYLSALLLEIKQHYRESLLLAGTDFTIGEYADCLLAGDVDRSVEILQNFIENAVKYGDGRWILLRISQEENCVLVTVDNSGCTLFDAELPHIFESFWRGSNVGAAPGSGLGLFICQKLIHQMGGEVFAVREGDV